jgi:hypothetical protein
MLLYSVKKIHNMRKRFNDTGICNPNMHYMVDTTEKLNKIAELVIDGLYFTINRPYQYGKTTSSYLLANKLMKENNYLALQTSFEGIGDEIFEEEGKFCSGFFDILSHELHFLGEDQLIQEIIAKEQPVTSFNQLSSVITDLSNRSEKNIVLMIDEVDKSSNNQLFISFLGMLRGKYLSRNMGRDYTFHSVILIGVHDVKSLKLKIHPDSTGKLNSPWNIAVDFNVDLSFNHKDISTMLDDYSRDRQVEMDIESIAERIYYYTNGYPYLVSKMCKIVDETIKGINNNESWTLTDINEAYKSLTYQGYTTTLFDHLFKSLENNEELFQVVLNISINGKTINFNINNPVINLGNLYGIIADYNGLCKIHNRIFEQRIYNYFVSKAYLKYSDVLPSSYITSFIRNNQLNLREVLLRFQQFMKENYSPKDAKFIEREGRLLFLSFLKPIINGKGFDFKEPNVGDERRMDIVITFNDKKYVVELKIWYGQEYHQRGLRQLSVYLDLNNLDKGYLLIFDFNKTKEFKQETIKFGDKELFAVWV